MNLSDRQHIVAAILASAGQRDVSDAYIAYRRALGLLANFGDEPFEPGAQAPDLGVKRGTPFSEPKSGSGAGAPHD